ncbi:MAG TPA: TetR family transcriptional regulator [Erythrobacter sp.]|nr:TetR family transcriptional regulator [Erythrobacter sp.]
MARKSVAVRSTIEGEKPHTDGRRERSRASRRAIIRAMMDLIVEGDIDPSAARVAERAGVGLRSVFRHFDEKESLYREMDAILTEAYEPKLREPYKSSDWREQLGELVERRAKFYEEIAPFRVSTSIQRFRSPTLMESYRRLLKAEHKALYAILPNRVRNDEQRTRAILLSTSFDSWRLFRQDEELSKRKTIEAIKQLLQDILDQIDD